ncbi:hypothetical protein N6H14_10650 [Paenibacillus sp. CC-CFT747]|nr:hypothetical protein N6H14_10650 [Paenibacillus sp. CC-CFT747]
MTSAQGQESKDKAVTLSKSQTAKTGEGSGKAEVRNAEAPSGGSQAEESKETPKVEARSFFWDLLKSFFGWIKGLFA